MSLIYYVDTYFLQKSDAAVMHAGKRSKAVKVFTRRKKRN